MVGVGVWVSVIVGVIVSSGVSVTVGEFQDSTISCVKDSRHNGVP